jgi:hypothetical protein
MPPYGDNSLAMLLNGIGVALVHAVGGGWKEYDYHGRVTALVPIDGINLRANSKYLTGYA